MTAAPHHAVAVAGVVVDDDGRVLVIKRRDNGRWEAPGGVLELDETFEVGVRREVAEETGVDVAVEHLTGVYKNVVRKVVVLVFRCRPLSGQPHETDEAAAARWIDPAEIESLVLPAYAVRITDALHGGAAASRAHDGVRLIDP
jgi:8-oxo-dGTP diphosphatase